MRNLIDNGSSVDIIFARALDQLDLPDKTLRPVKNNLRDFAGNEVVPLGQISLRVTFGTFSKCVTVNINFVDVDSPSVYNTIIGRITQHLIQGFPTPFGIGMCEGIQTLSWETYRVATSFQMEQLKYPPNTFPLGPNIPEKPIEVYDWMECGTVDYGYLTKVIPLGSLDPRDDQFSQRGAPVKDLEEVYIDDMLVKSILAEDHIHHLEQSFQALGKYRMWLNPSKCAFGVESGKFLGFMVYYRGIEANPKKIQTLVEMKSPTKVKDSLPFFKALKKGADFVWTDDCEQSFQELKIYLGRVPLLSRPIQGEVLSLYLAVSEAAVSAALVRGKEGRELPVFYVSKALIDPETRYLDTEKIMLALVVAARKLRPYF
ncbi:hypothetical protein UlMin_013337 [Ulmus minor]